MMTAATKLLLPALVAAAACAPADASPAAPAGNLLFNGDFERDADGDGAADGWQFSGDPKGLTAKLSLDKGRRGGKCQRLACTSYTGGSGWSHAMLCQLDKVAVKKGHLYVVSFWARAKDIEDYAVGVGLQETAKWQALGLRDSFVPTERWERYEFRFVAERTCTRHSRFQVWFNSAGTLWIDEAKIVEGPPPHGTGLQRPVHVHRAPAGGNPVPNASFECGAAGWGSQSMGYYGWGTPINRLFGKVVADESAPHGRRCLEIALNPKTQPVAYFDYFQLVRHAIRAPLAGNVGFIALTPGRPCAVSAWLRADADGTPAGLGVRYFGGGSDVARVLVGRQWKQYVHTFKARRNAGYVLVGPDLRDAPGRTCMLRVDAVRLDADGRGREFAAREPVEMGLSTEREGNIFPAGQPLRVLASVHNAARAARDVRIELSVTDFRDRTVQEAKAAATVPPGGTVERAFDLGRRPRGFYRVRAAADGRAAINDLRVAVIREHRRKDSVIGLNHAYGWDELTKACVEAGIVWARDWSLKWQHVEPVKGRFDFAEADHQIGRALRLGHTVLGLLPFPSANWSSSAPASVKVTRAYPGNRRRMYYAPRDIGEFKAYVSRTVAHYRGRVKWWQVFNEPLYTDYSLPRKAGYKPADYVRLVKAFHQAAKAADPDCRVLAGPGGWLMGSGRDIEAMLAAGLFEACDALDLHVYPGLRPPEALERDLARIAQMMDKAGGRKPMWLTEHAYYADDDFLAVPPRPGFLKPLPSERVQAEYSVRLNLILLAGGIRRIFYHAGSSPGLNRDHPESVFFDYGGQPRKVLPAVAAFAELFSPEVKFLKDLSARGDCRALLFRDGPRLILAAWQPRKGQPMRIRVAGRGASLLDVFGNPIAGRQKALSSCPVFAVAEALSQGDFEKAVVIEALPGQP